MASATYTVDDQDPINFVVPVSSNSNTYFNQILFETGQFPFGQHKLVVQYLGNSTTVPLALNYFLQPPKDASFSTSSNNTTTGSIPSSTSSSSNSSPSSSATIQVHSLGKPTGAIIGGVIGGIVLISLLLALLFFNRRRKKRIQALSEKSSSIRVPSPDIYVNPFIVPSLNPTSTFLPQNYTSNGQSIPSQSISSKLAERGQPSDPVSPSSSGGIPLLTPLRAQFSSPASNSPSSSSLHLVGSQTNLDGTKTRVLQAATEPSIQRSPSPEGANDRILLHEDSGVRIPPAEGGVLELPPTYTPG